MRPFPKFLAGVTLVLAALSGSAVQAECVDAANEDLRYSWRLRGPLAWIAGIAFPTSGKGFLRTVSPSENILDAELRIAGESPQDGFYIYQSQIEEDVSRTLTSYHAYAWRNKRRSERTLFDYVRRLARIRKENTERVENRVRPLAQTGVRDVLTGIFYLRQNATEIHEPVTSEIYSEGKLYPVVFKPMGDETLTLQGRRISTRKFEISAAPGIEKKWPGGVKVWLSNDENRTPVRIEIKRDMAALQLDLQPALSCAAR